MRISLVLRTLSITLLLATHVEPAFGHCRIDRSNLTMEERLRLEEWDRRVEAAHNLADLFELAANAVACADVADEMPMTTGEHIACVANGTDAMDEKRAERLHSMVEATRIQYRTDADKRTFLIVNGWGQFLAEE